MISTNPQILSGYLADLSSETRKSTIAGILQPDFDLTSHVAPYGYPPKLNLRVRKTARYRILSHPLYFRVPYSARHTAAKKKKKG